MFIANIAGINPKNKRLPNNYRTTSYLKRVRIVTICKRKLFNNQLFNIVVLMAD
jgi:hypothetical protein